MTFLDMIIKLVADILGLPQGNDANDYVPIEPKKNNYIGEDLDCSPLPDDEEYLAPPIPDDGEDFLAEDDDDFCRS